MTEKKDKNILIRVSKKEYERIKHQSKKVNLSISDYIRKTALNKKIISLIDLDEVEKIIKVSGDLGRLGGLLKMLLTNKEYEYNHKIAKDVLTKILDKQKDLQPIIRKILK